VGILGLVVVIYKTNLRIPPGKDIIEEAKFICGGIFMDRVHLERET